MKDGSQRTIELSPRASVMIEAMRDIGYSFEAAVADIIDNSIAAKANVIDVRFGWAAEEPWIAVVDNGSGMDREELLEAMRPGSKNPLEQRAKDDLGRFGLGLKTASFSQCRDLTVLTRQSGVKCCFKWDLDLVAQSDSWTILELGEEEVAGIPCRAALGETGTLVVWRKIDRLDLAGLGEKGHEAFNGLMDGVRQHLSRIFHRFLAGELGLKRIEIRLNNSLIEPYDPFNEGNIATQKLLPEHVRIGEGSVSIQPFILPHHSKVSPSDYDRLAGPEGYLRNQGFYVYRNRRLILWGSWFRMARQEELTKLARVRIDIPNNLDYQWGIDVRKSRAHPPLIVRNRLRQVIDQIRSGAKRPFTSRGRIVLEAGLQTTWVRRLQNDRIDYVVNAEHPILSELLGDLDAPARDRLRRVLSMLSQTFPAAAFFSDYASSPKQLEPSSPTLATLVELALMMGEELSKLDEAGIRERLAGVDPFARFPELIAGIASRVARR